jgi:hypothetical protein
MTHSHEYNAGLNVGPSCTYSTLAGTSAPWNSHSSAYQIVPSYGAAYSYPVLPSASSCSGYAGIGSAYGSGSCAPKFVRRQCQQ